jgi:hypothetical protein
MWRNGARCFLGRAFAMQPAYTLNILGYNYFKKDADALRIYALYDPETNESFYNTFEFYRPVTYPKTR